MVDDTWVDISTTDGFRSCPDYNRWEWGLSEGGEHCSYKDDTLARFNGDVDAVAERYARRSVVYLVGEEDRCTVAGTEPGYCNSHGLEVTCADVLQGVPYLYVCVRVVCFVDV